MRREIVHRLFWLSLLVKGVDGILELVGGVLLFVVENAAITRLITALTAPELTEDPHDLIANTVLHALRHLSADTRYFAAAYLFGHGAVKVFFVAGLWRDKLWVFPIALAVISAFILYQLYRLSQHSSVSLILLTIVDVFVVAVI